MDECGLNCQLHSGSGKFNLAVRSLRGANIGGWFLRQAGDLEVEKAAL